MINVQGVWVGGGALLVLAGAILVGGAGQASGQAGATMSIAPASRNVPTNSAAFNVDINVANVTNLGAYEFTVTFDPQTLEYIGSADNGFLAATGRSQTCFGFGQQAANVNTYKALHAGCATNGLIENDQGAKGPNGSASVATIAFKPKTVGASNLIFVGMDDGAKYYIGAPDPSKIDGAVEQAHTALSQVEVCVNNVCVAENIAFNDQTGAVGVYDPSQAAPTALPPTPTPEPRSNRSEADVRKTVAAAIGTPRVLSTPVAGDGTTSGTDGTTSGTDGSTSGTDGATSGTDGATSGTDGTGSGPGAGGGALGASGGPGASPGGVPRGPDGVPIAGYGRPDEPASPWWMRTGLLMLALGLAAISLGATQRRTPLTDRRREDI